MTRSIDLDIEVPGTPEEVWEAVATGPGITAWFVPAEVEPREGGEMTMDFGPGFGVEHAKVTVWDPPRRFVAESEMNGRTFAGEWLVEAKGEGTCVVRLIYSGFGDDADWDDQYDSMTAGWKLFMYNLRLYLTHFKGRPCTSVLVNGGATGTLDEVWSALLKSVGVTAPEPGDHVTVAGEATPPMAGTVERVSEGMLTLLLDEPAPGIGFVCAEPNGQGWITSVYLYLFGDDASSVAARDEPVWRAWMQEHFPMEIA